MYQRGKQNQLKDKSEPNNPNLYITFCSQSERLTHEELV